jgi:hypothetical protein
VHLSVYGAGAPIEVRNFFVLSHVVLIVRRSSKSDASYVINFVEYEILANKICKKHLSKPITVFIDMAAVEKAFAKVSIC